MTFDNVVNGLDGLDAKAAALVGAIKELRAKAVGATRNKTTYIIWKNQDDRNVADVNEVVGLFTGTHDEADAVLERLNAADDSVKEGLGGRQRFGYWRSEPTVITPATLNEIVESFQ